MHTVTPQDRIEAGDHAASLVNILKREIVAAEAAVAYYNTSREMQYISGGYILTDGAGNYIMRGLDGAQLRLAPGVDGLRGVSRYVTVKEASTIIERFGRWFPEAPVVHATTHRRAVEDHLDRLKRRLAEQEKIVRASDPYFDGSGAAQDFHANGGT